MVVVHARNVLPPPVQDLARGLPQAAIIGERSFDAMQLRIDAGPFELQRLRSLDGSAWSPAWGKNIRQSISRIPIAGAWRQFRSSRHMPLLANRYAPHGSLFPGPKVLFREA